jgi:LuxR family maltose regulon positive regulatory protein
MLSAIQAGRARRLLLVQAPAGYGKTTLLAQWRELALARGALVAWIGLEASDRTARTLVEAILSALAHAGVPLPDELLSAATRAQPDEVLDALLRLDEQRQRETWLVLDDWHFAESDEAAAVVERLLRRMPDRWHVALSSRWRPQLNLLAHRARGQVLEFGQNDLRFSADETRALMQDAASSDAVVAELAAITEGWPIALAVSQLWLSNAGDLDALRASFVGSIDGMADYLASEIFAGLSPEMRAFLVETSICVRFNNHLADNVRQRTDSAALMESLRALRGLAIPLDGEGRWYRHHRIFAEFLERERARLPADQVAILHRSAADWFEREGLIVEAVAHARASGDNARAGAIVESAQCVDICLRHGASAVRALLDTLPSDEVERRPRLCAAKAATRLKHGSIAEAGRAIADLQGLVAAGSGDPALRRDVTIVASLRECFIDGVPSLADIADLHRTIERMDPAEWWILGLMRNVEGRLELRRGLLVDSAKSLARADVIFQRGGSAHGHFFMLANVAVCRLFLGQLADAEWGLNAARQVLAEGVEASDSYEGVTRTIEAVLYHERGMGTAAGKAAALALAGLERAEGCFEQYFLSTLVAARAAFVDKGLDAALRVLERGRHLARYHGLPRVDGLLDALHARLLIDSDRAEDAERLIAATGLALTRDEGEWLEADHADPVLCLLAIKAGDAARAQKIAAVMAARCRAGGRVPSMIRALLLEALAAAALGDAVAERRLLGEALQAAAKETICQPFLEHGPPLSAMLRALVTQQDAALPTAEAIFLDDLIQRIDAAYKARWLIDRLTLRERDILRQLHPGRSNKMIARDLALSESAVKFHLKNVFRKLEIDNRSIAAEIGQRLG